MDENEIEYGWPGDGSGMDDLADYMQQEARDYENEGDDSHCEEDMGDEEPDAPYEDHGGEDSGLDAAYEDRTDLGD